MQRAEAKQRYLRFLQRIRCNSSSSSIHQHHDNLVFSTRVAVSMTIAALFTVITPNGVSYPQPQWIGASAGIVAWQNTSDTASAIKRAMERTLGTGIGAVLGVAVGFLSLSTHSESVQANVLGYGMAVVCFLLPFLSTRLGLRDSYAARMSLVTYSIVSLSFYRTPDCYGEPWSVGVWRAVNIVLGCFVGVSSLVLWPRSTKSMIQARVTNQLQVAGESVASVLDSAHSAFVNRQKPLHWDCFHRDRVNPKSDAAYDAYLKGAHGWKSCSELFALLKYDPFGYRSPSQERMKFQESMSILSERVFRLHTTLVVVDSIVRGGIGLQADKSMVSASPESLEALKRIGDRAKIMLSTDGGSLQEREKAFEALINEDLMEVGRWIERQERIQAKNQDAGSADGPSSLSQVQRLLLSRYEDDVDNVHVSSPLQLLQGHQQISLLLLLVEQLILRVARLYCLSQDLLTVNKVA